MMKMLHLVLQSFWYHQIEEGTKKVEFRDNTPFWRRRILTKEAFQAYNLLKDANNQPIDFSKPLPQNFLKHSIIVFHEGYTKKIMTFGISKVEIFDEQIEIHLGARLSNSDLEEMERLIASRPALAPPLPRRIGASVAETQWR